ncbi:MAG: TIM barrel protein [Acidobacteria bacterium]|nr:TIM barrel protein [Acidobacteriota bacterium]
MLEKIQQETREQQMEIAGKMLASRGIDLKEFKSRIAAFAVEVPSWGFGRGGTRFASYRDGAEPDDVRGKLRMAGICHRLTGATPTVALHFPWDGDDYAQISGWLKEEGLRAGAVNSNSFAPRESPLDYRLKWGSLTNPLPDVRRAAVAHHVQCLQIMRELDSRILSLWLHDGTNSAGQLSLFEQAKLLEKGLQEIYDALGSDQCIFIEYKLFEPAFYATAIADWGRAYALCTKLGDRAKVLVDLGHHALGTNIEQIVANLQGLGKLGGFHFNDKKYADDDLATGSIDPFQLFRIFNVLVEAELRGLQRISDVAFMIDESHNLKDPLEEMLEAVDNIQRAYAQALSVDREAWREAQNEADAELADQILKSAFFDTPVNAILQTVRLERGCPADPVEEYRAKYKRPVRAVVA